MKKKSSGRAPRIVSRKVIHKTPWFSLVAKQVQGSKAPYYSLKLPDYVTVFAVTKTGGVVLVRQFRPAVEAFTLEFPSGIMDQGELPEQTARRELIEETGYEAGRLELMGRTLVPDTGRIANRLWCFFAADVVPKSPRPPHEPGVQPQILQHSNFVRMIRRGEFNHALHLAVAFMAVASGKWRLDSARGR